MTGRKIEYTYKDATHLLRCVHRIGASYKIYYMNCIPIKIMPGDRLKIIVFGERYWRDKQHISHIRYVPAYRVILNDEP